MGRNRHRSDLWSPHPGGANSRLRSGQAQTNSRHHWLDPWDLAERVAHGKSPEPVGSCLNIHPGGSVVGDNGVSRRVGKIAEVPGPFDTDVEGCPADGRLDTPVLGIDWRWGNFFCCALLAPSVSNPQRQRSADGGHPSRRWDHCPADEPLPWMQRELLDRALRDRLPVMRRAELGVRGRMLFHLPRGLPCLRWGQHRRVRALHGVCGSMVPTLRFISLLSAMGPRLLRLRTVPRTLGRASSC